MTSRKVANSGTSNTTLAVKKMYNNKRIIDKTVCNKNAGGVADKFHFIKRSDNRWYRKDTLGLIHGYEKSRFLLDICAK